MMQPRDDIPHAGVVPLRQRRRQRDLQGFCDFTDMPLLLGLQCLVGEMKIVGDQQRQHHGLHPQCDQGKLVAQGQALQPGLHRIALNACSTCSA